jgi:hypothetical protein
MDPITISAALAAAGLLSSLSSSAAAAHKQQVTGEMQAASEKAAPWLALVHAQPDQTKTEFAGPVAGSLIQGALGGYGLGQNIQNAAEKNNMNKELLKSLTNNAAGKAQGADMMDPSSPNFVGPPAPSQSMDPMALEALLSQGMPNALQGSTVMPATLFSGGGQA